MTDLYDEIDYLGTPESSDEAMTETVKEIIDRLSAEERGQRLLVAALSTCATGRKTASSSLCDEAAKQLSALWAARDTMEAEVERLLDVLGQLEKQASETSRRGAVIGPHWTRLTTAILYARAALKGADQ